MSETLDMRVNRLSAKTWYRLKMNDSAVTLPAGESVKNVSAEAVCTASPDPAFAAVKGGMGPDIEKLLSLGTFGERSFLAENGKEETVRLSYAFGDDEQGRDRVCLKAAEGSTLTAVMDFAGGKSDGTSVVQTKVLVEKNARVRLVQVHRTGDAYTVLNDTGAVLDESASFEVVHVVLSGKGNYLGCEVELRGAESSFTASTGYTADADHRVDMNYNVIHEGKKTVCEMNALGVLRDQAFKVYRGTIDFKKGCAQSVGNEKEDVLLLDNGVVNQTIPIILCAEEDVEGNHGATIGELSEETMFYLRSRGLTAEQVYELVARGRLDSVIEKIPDDTMKNELLGGCEQHDLAGRERRKHE